MIAVSRCSEARMGVSSEVGKGEAAARIVEAAASEKEVAADMAVGAAVGAAVAVAVVADLSCQKKIGHRDYEDVI
jgi:hypothetical protein